MGRSQNHLGADKPISPHVVWFSNTIGDNYRHFKKFSNPEEARANPPNILVNRVKDWHFIYDHYLTRQFQEQSRTNKAARVIKQSYNHSSKSNKIKCWNSIPNPPQKFLNPFQRSRYARPFWIDDCATQKVLVGTPSPSPERVLAVLHLHMSKRCIPERFAN
ncbi:CACTA en-spm transposon protein [Cucumis melo var. makuwa]|uniref:CACTA en-spm transposon protein n=1 Tax=Cucumis melo var. makuwa TaxID=1194695 RepID=A0A5D3CN43_CUCMM|nr:CACTA en-spm transposon protein [Cucumis melo var. makuwa]TYK11669.1 CACTA en-spm transposon protein [Cucumis melo var. makuwa]